MMDPGMPTGSEFLFLLLGVAIGYLARALLHDDASAEGK
jgi:hypothetical protein